jgi:hypothetical protein
MLNRKWISVLVGTLLFTAALPAAAAPPALWWASRIVKVSGFNNCLNIGQEAMRRQNLTGISRDRLGVGGFTQNSYAVITCVEGANRRLTAMVMVAGNDRAEAERLRTALADYVSRVTPID